MATVTLIGSTFTTSPGTKSFVGFPAVGDVIVLVVGHTASSSTVAPTDDQSGGTYVEGPSAVKASSADKLQVWVREGLTPAAVSTTFSHAPGGSTTGGGLCVLGVAGMSKVGSSAIKQSGTDNNRGSGVTPSVTLEAAALTGNLMVGAVLHGDGFPITTPPSLWTEQLDTGYGTPTTGLEVTSRNSGFTGSTVTWGNNLSGGLCALVVELDTSEVSVPASLPPPRMGFQALVAR